MSFYFKILKAYITAKNMLPNDSGSKKILRSLMNNTEDTECTKSKRAIDAKTFLIQ